MVARMSSWNKAVFGLAFFLFFGLEVISFLLIFQNNKFQRANFINSANYFSGVLFEARTELTSYLSLKKKYEAMAIENASLRTAALNLGTGEVNEFFHPDSATAANYHYIPAKVINNSIYKTNNYIRPRKTDS